MIKCPNCTGEMEFDPKAQEVVCQYCGSKFNPKELNEKVKHAKEEKQIEKYEGKSYTCSQCGATLMTFDETAITFCSYCGSQAMIESKMMKINNPDFIIPFEINKEDCIKAYKNKIKQTLFSPDYIKSDITLEKFRGIYIPYAIYKLEHKGQTKNKGSKYSHRVGDYQYYDDYTITANVDATYEGVSYDLISKFYDKYSTAIPYNYQKRQEFNPNFLIGYYADAGDVDSSIYDLDASKVAESDASRRLRANREFAKYGCSNPSVGLNVTERKVGMFPVYFLAIRNKKNDAVHYAIVNGQSGKVVADLPISFPKYIVASLILSLVIFLLINNLFILTPLKVSIFSVIASILSLVLSGIQSVKINEHESHIDDKGYRSKQDQTKKTKKQPIFKYLYKEILAIIISILIIILNPVNDIYYYSVTLIALSLVILSFRDLVKEHNILATNRPPQLEKRGGDENA